MRSRGQASGASFRSGANCRGFFRREPPRKRSSLFTDPAAIFFLRIWRSSRRHPRKRAGKPSASAAASSVLSHAYAWRTSPRNAARNAGKFAKVPETRGLRSLPTANSAPQQNRGNDPVNRRRGEVRKKPHRSLMCGIQGSLNADYRAEYPKTYRARQRDDSSHFASPEHRERQEGEGQEKPLGIVHQSR